MKRWLASLTALFTLATLAPHAMAAGINLAWSNCFPTGLADLSPVCNIASNGNVYLLYGSAVSGVAIPDLASQADVIDVQVANPTLDDWWMFASGECRDGSLFITFQGFPNTTTCNKTLFGGSIVPLSDWASKFGVQNRARLRLVCSRVTGTAMSATTQYQLFQIYIDGQHSAFDPADPGTPECGGCSDQALIVFNFCQLQAISGSNLLLTTPNNNPVGRQHVTWQANPVPARRQTWGQIKSLYR